MKERAKLQQTKSNVFGAANLEYGYATDRRIMQTIVADGHY
ncbi:hypothetical protein [Alicyclobacillus dauci]|uniref:Uncharacterized protein n=1 Tax=Alicyclobacillus dauci TaxID=1475485 RepID=A0ABY6Z495_9BACL|nr:hypothetical protein [Alicyclobacillus dauci]WAH37016.1 hypothetical protein NZD86_00045 [Alicyclobacillus dauci]